MQSMNNKWWVRALRVLPKPAAVFLIDRVFRPLILMVAATAVGLTFLFGMLVVAVVAPFAPVKAKDMFYKLTEGFI